MKTVYLSLGSNQGKREEHLQRAVDLLAQAGIHPRRCSQTLETEPQELARQPWFLNLVVEAETDLLPMQALAKIMSIEHELGRERKVSKGPRTIDIDILLWGRFVIQTSRLTVPHPRLRERRFVLEPIAELAPDLRHPAYRKTMRELLALIHGQSVRRHPFRPVLPEPPRTIGVE